MLKVYEVARSVVRRMAPVCREIANHDPDLARQGREALASVLLNMGEGSCSLGRNRHARYGNAAGSMNEALGVLDAAEDLEYVAAEQIAQTWVVECRRVQDRITSEPIDVDRRRDRDGRNRLDYRAPMLARSLLPRGSDARGRRADLSMGRTLARHRDPGNVDSRHDDPVLISKWRRLISEDDRAFTARRQTGLSGTRWRAQRGAYFRR